MKNIILALLLAGMSFFLVIPQSAMAFSCKSNGVNIGGEGTFNIPIDVTLDKTGNSIILTDMAAYTTCVGIVSYSDALQVISASIAPALINMGYSGFINTFGQNYNMPIGAPICVWADGACSLNFVDFRDIPLKVKIGISRNNLSPPSGTVIPAGQTVASLTVQQRSGVTWGWRKTWNFTAKNPVVVPAYACKVSNPSQSVVLPNVKKADIQKNGPGIYSAATTAFNINLTCDPKTTVSVTFDGTTLNGVNNVLGNTASGNDNVGIQVLFNKIPVIFGSSMTVISSANAQETLPFNAYYYYNGGAISSGKVTALSTFTFNYN